MQAIDVGSRASYVLFDSWFSFPRHILALKETGLDVIAHIKRTPKVYYRYGGQMLSAPEIYRRNRKRRGAASISCPSGSR